MRDITKIIIHCAATREGQNVKTSTIRKWHTAPAPKGRGWSDIGYHYVIELDGKVVEGRPLERRGAHTKGQNTCSIGICYVGGVDEDLKPKDTRTPEQKEAMYQLIAELQEQFPKAKLHGHNEFANKACPSFDVQTEF